MRPPLHTNRSMPKTGQAQKYIRRIFERAFIYRCSRARSPIPCPDDLRATPAESTGTRVGGGRSAWSIALPIEQLWLDPWPTGASLPPTSYASTHAPARK